MWASVGGEKIYLKEKVINIPTLVVLDCVLVLYNNIVYRNSRRSVQIPLMLNNIFRMTIIEVKKKFINVIKCIKYHKQSITLGQLHHIEWDFYGTSTFHLGKKKWRKKATFFWLNLQLFEFHSGSRSPSSNSGTNM